MSDNDLHDDVLFDRLVDGELSSGERRQLLASLDDRPDGWRRCALAFLEAQSWSEELGEFVRDPADSPAASANFSLLRSLPVAKKRGAAWLAIAAGLLVAFTLGALSRNGGAPVASNINADRDTQLADASPSPVQPDPADPLTANDALTLWARDETGRTRPFQVPLVDAGTLDEQLGLQFQTGVPELVRNQLQDRGFDVQSKRRYAPLLLENGPSIIVPVEDTRIVPVSQNVY
jgi:hypothetical protein